MTQHKFKAYDGAKPGKVQALECKAWDKNRLFTVVTLQGICHAFKTEFPSQTFRGMTRENRQYYISSVFTDTTNDFTNLGLSSR